MPVNVRSSQLNSTVQTYTGLGWSVIPTQGKVAAVRWSAYQKRCATASELVAWFSDPAISAAAVVTGPVSHLLILDFDTPQSFCEFQTALPAYCQTLTVKTRRGLHLYFHVPDETGQGMRSGKADGIDILYSGRYAILPGSTVDGHTYHITQSLPPRPLSSADWAAISGFLQNRRFKPLNKSQGRSTPNSRQNAVKRLIWPNSAISQSEQQPLTPVDNLRWLYTSFVASGMGRNNALFTCACFGRDSGLDSQAVITTLAQLHAEQKPPPGHASEGYRVRYQEALRTIHSAFSKPPRPEPLKVQQHAGLPNSARERLLKQRQASLIRVIEGLRLKGIRPGMAFTAPQAVELLRGVVGRDAVWAALSSGFFPAPPNPLSPAAYGVANDLRQKPNKNCVLIRVTKSVRSRQPRHFLMPANSQVAARLGIRDGSLSDPLSLDDLRSSKQTRIALHREFLLRRPGDYPMKLFAVRLGVSVRTVQRYHASDPKFRQETTCDAQAITWHNVDRALPDFVPHEGCFLLDGRGKRYPLKIPIAKKLLAAKQPVWYLRQRPSYWWYGERQTTGERELFSELETPSSAIPLIQNHSVADRHPLYALFPEDDSVAYIPVEAGQAHISQNHSVQPQGSVLPEMGQGQQKKELAGMRVMHYTPAVDPGRLERMALRLRETINAMSGETPPECIRHHRMSLGTARRLLEQYGEKAVWRAVKIVEKRSNVAKPVGLLSVILRSERTAGQLEKAFTL